MIDYKFFQESLRAFSARFKDHSYDDYLIKLLYEDLNYLNSNQLDFLLAHYFKRVNKNFFLPSHSALFELASNLFEKPIREKKQIEIKDCGFCFNSGVVKARLRINPTERTVFRCFCEHGKHYTKIPLWEDKFKEKFETLFEYYDKKPKPKINDLIEVCSGKGIKGELPGTIKTLGESLTSGLEEMKIEKKVQEN